MREAITIELPYPPSMNHYWRHIPGGRPKISKEGRLFRTNVAAIVMASGIGRPIGVRAFEHPDRLRLTVQVQPPDRRRRDLDNTLKPLLDAMQHAGVYRDDCQIDELFVIRRGVVPAGCVLVTLACIEE